MDRKIIDPKSSLPISLQSPEINDDESYNENDMPMILNTQTAMYDYLIREQNRKIERLQLRNEKLEEFCDLSKSNLNLKNAQIETEVVELNKSISALSKKIDTIKEKQNDICAAQEEEQRLFSEKANEISKGFEKRRIELFFELNKLNGKINMLDDFKESEAKLVSKYKSQNEEIRRKENEVAQALDQIEFKSKLHKESLKKETYKSILNVSQEFQGELQNTIPHTLQRLMRENIILVNELHRLKDDLQWTNRKTDYYVTEADTLKNKIRESKIGMNFAMSKIQKEVIKQLRLARVKAKENLFKHKIPDKNFEQHYLHFLDELSKLDIVNYPQHNRKLEIMLHQESYQMNLTNNLKNRFSEALEKSHDLFLNLKSTIKNYILRDQMGSDVDTLNNIADHLLSIIKMFDKYTFEKYSFTPESIVSIPDAATVYQTGDLGFDPTPVYIEDVRKIKYSGEFSPSVLAFFEELETKATDLQEETKDMIKSESISSEKSTSSELEKSRASSKVSESEGTEVLSDEMEGYEDEEFPYDLLDFYNDYL